MHIVAKLDLYGIRIQYSFTLLLPLSQSRPQSLMSKVQIDWLVWHSMTTNINMIKGLLKYHIGQTYDVGQNKRFADPSPYK